MTVLVFLAGVAVASAFSFAATRFVMGRAYKVDPTLKPHLRRALNGKGPDPYFAEHESPSEWRTDWDSDGTTRVTLVWRHRRAPEWFVRAVSLGDLRGDR